MSRLTKETLPESSPRDIQLELLKFALGRTAYPGYPEFDERLFMPESDFGPNLDNQLVLPGGPWETSPGQDEDMQERPLHPWFKEMVTDRQIGVVTGKGAYWNWGRNLTADPVVIYRGSLLLVKRADTGNYSLPGGFIDSGEDPETTARRETLEETGLAIPQGTIPKEIYCGPVIDIRVTANAWAETTAYLYQLDSDKQFGPLRGSSENTESLWVPIEQITNQILFGAHKYLTMLAIRQLENQ
jgi:ADP-ribose pyrophosphatase YjhB (NUDIX family)